MKQHRERNRHDHLKRADWYSGETSFKHQCRQPILRMENRQPVLEVRSKREMRIDAGEEGLPRVLCGGNAKSIPV